MNPLKLIGDAVIRYRRTRGFGVHSPFAYGFITQVLGSRYPFYCWDKLEAEVRHDSKMRWRDARALFRTLNQFAPGKVYSAPDDRHGAMRIVRAWSNSCEISADPVECPFLIVGDDEPEDATAIIAGEKTVFFTSVRNPLWTRLVADMERGQSFTNSVTGIAVCNPKLPRHHFKISY